MTTSDAPSLRAIADSLAGTFPCCDDAPLARALLRELARGEPVSASALAAAADRDDADTVAALARWPNVKLDDDGSVVAFSGLSLRPTAHHAEVNDRPLHAWCAWDTLFLPALLDQPARVHSRCPISDADVRLTVEPDGVRERAPDSLRVSFPPPGSASTSDITSSFCCHVHFLADHEGAMVLTLDEAFELGRLATRPLLTTGP